MVAAPELEHSSVPDPPERPSLVFIAEDNPILLQGLERALSANGYQVATAEDGRKLLSLLDAARTLPDLLLLDVMMPGMSGFEVLQAVNEEPRWRGVPVMLITATTDETLAAAAQRRGAVEVLIKPFRLGELLARIEEHVASYRKRLAARGTGGEAALGIVP